MSTKNEGACSVRRPDQLGRLSLVLAKPEAVPMQPFRIFISGDVFSPRIPAINRDLTFSTDYVHE